MTKLNRDDSDLVDSSLSHSLISLELPSLVLIAE